MKLLSKPRKEEKDRDLGVDREGSTTRTEAPAANLMLAGRRFLAATENEWVPIVGVVVMWAMIIACLVTPNP